jgi:hypothetical protein
MKLKKKFEEFKYKIIELYRDEFAGNLVEYVLLIGFALFMFLVLIAIVSSMFDWTLDQSNEFFDFIEQLSG